MSDLRQDIEDFVTCIDGIKEQEKSLKNNFIEKINNNQINSFLKYERKKLIRERHKLAIISCWMVIVLYSIVVFFFIWFNNQIFV